MHRCGEGARQVSLHNSVVLVVSWQGRRVGIANLAGITLGGHFFAVRRQKAASELSISNVDVVNRQRTLVCLVKLLVPVNQALLNRPDLILVNVQLPIINDRHCVS